MPTALLFLSLMAALHATPTQAECRLVASIYAAQADLLSGPYQWAKLEPCRRLHWLHPDAALVEALRPPAPRLLLDVPHFIIRPVREGNC